MDRLRVGILGATGIVGQRIVERLSDHPWFVTTAVAASERSVGRRYGESVRWTVSEDPPPAVAALSVAPCHPDAMRDCDLVLSALDAANAREIEPLFVRAGFPVVSNASAHRMHDRVPLIVPEVNVAHLAIVESTAARGEGFVVTNPNCSVTGLVMALAPLHRAFGVRRVVVTTLQALSGAGLDGPRGVEIEENVIPFIPGEEDKIEEEPAKILGTVEGDRVVKADVRLSAHCHRVPVLDGHLEAVSVELGTRVDPLDAESVLGGFTGDVADLGLPSAPERPIVLRREADRPQPRRDRGAGGGMSVVVGRIRGCPVLDLRMEVLSHNAVRGAAGGTLLNAELLVAKGLVRRGRTS